MSRCSFSVVQVDHDLAAVCKIFPPCRVSHGCPVLKYEKGHSGQKCYLHCCSHLNEVPYAVIITYICIYANF